MKKIIIIPDSFKGSASSLEVCNSIEKGVLKVFKDAKIKIRSSSNTEEPQWSDWFGVISSQTIGDGIIVNNDIISVPEYEGATVDTSATSGLVPPATSKEYINFLRGDGSWQPIDLENYATKTELNNLLNKIMPVGSIYVQYPSQSDPTTLFGGTWTNISNTYAGRFFRTEGGSAATFGSSQSGGVPNISGVFHALRWNGDNNINDVIEDGCIHCVINFKNGTIFTTADQYEFGTSTYEINASRSSSLYGAATEVRPINSTIRIWKRTK